MKGKSKMWFLTVLLAVFLAGCGKEGKDTQQAISSSVSGVASKGPIDSGTVKVYALNADGSTGSLLGTTTTGSDGSYSISLGSYTGNVLVEVTDGRYTDEATGTPNVPNPGLRAAVADISGTVSVAVTPLTEIAVQYAGTSLTKEKIEQANYLIGVLAGVDIISTQPANVIDATASSEATVDQINYGLMLAAISQMAKNGTTDVSGVILAIKNDLSDGKLDTTGASLTTALTNFIADTTRNLSGVTTLDQTNVDSAIDFIATNTVDPTLVTDISDLTKAKSLVSDMRNTVLSIYNYQGVGVPGIVETPFNNLSEELQTKIEPELALTVDRLNWILQSASYGPGEYDDLSIGKRLSITATDETNELGFSELTYTISNISTGETLSSGSLTVQNNTAGQITTGTFTGTLRTTSGGTVTASLSYSATVSGGIYTSMTFTGSMSAADSGSMTPWLSLDFSQSGRKLYAKFAQEPGSTDPTSIYPTSILASARITTTTAQMDGSLNISSIVWGSKAYEDWQYVNNTWQYGCVGEARPKTGTFTGSFEELSNGTTTGVKFSGTITGSYTNAAAYNGCALNDTSTNFSQWSASFDGKIEAPSRPTITAFLKATQSAYDKVALDINYKRTNTDGTVVYLSGSGTNTRSEDQYGNTRDILTATLTNQDGMKVTISDDEWETGDNQFTGSITTSGGSEMADLYTVNEVPMVKYSDGYFESIF